MSVDNVHAAKYQTPALETKDTPPHNRHMQEQLQPDVAPVEKPMIIWRSLMLEQ